MLVSDTSNNLADGVLAHRKKSGNLSLRYAGSCNFAHDSGLCRGQLGVATPLSGLSGAVASLMRLICGLSNPSKIISPSVEAVSIKVSAMLFVRARANKRLQYQAVDRPQLPAAPVSQGDCRIAPSQIRAEMCAALDAPNATQVGYFVQAIEIWDWEPIFHDQKVSCGGSVYKHESGGPEGIARTSSDRNAGEL